MWINRVKTDGVAGDSLHPSQRKMWLATAIGTGVALASSLIGGHKASNAARKAAARQRAREAEEDMWYNRRYNEEYADTAAGQNLLRRAKDAARENWRKAAGAQAVAGGTDAATQMAKDAGNRMVGDTLANIASMDSERRAQVDAAHNNSRERFAQMDINRELTRADNITQAAQGASNAIMQAGSAFESDIDLKGGKNKGI